MKPLREQAHVLLPSDQEKYFDFNEEMQISLTHDIVPMNDYEGIVLGTPSRIDIRIHDKIPLLWLERSSGLHNWQVETMRNSFIIISDLVNGSVTVYNAYAGEKRLAMRQIRRSCQGKKPDQEESEAGTVSINMLNAKRIMENRPLQPGVFAFTMSMYDWISNAVKTELFDPGKTDAPQPEQVISTESATELVSKYKVAAQNPASAALLVPSDKPPALEGTGVVLTAPEKVSLKDKRWVIYGSVNAAAAPGALVTASDKSDAPTAVITALLIVNKLDNEEPSWITLKLPVHTSGPCKAGDIVSSSFTVDLRRFTVGMNDPATYQLLLVSGEYVNGPHAVVVTR